jgi:hypothetical protein
VSKKKAAKKKTAKKKATKKKVAKKKAAKKKATKKKVAKKKTAKKKATKKKVTKKTTKKKTAPKKKTSKKKAIPKKDQKQVIVEKIEAAPPSKVPPFAVSTNDEEDVAADFNSTTEENEQGGFSLNDEYNPDDEQDSNAFGYGWSYDEGLDKPEDFTDEDVDPYDEDLAYAKGKPVGYDLDKADSSSDDDDEDPFV